MPFFSILSGEERVLVNELLEVGNSLENEVQQGGERGKLYNTFWTL